MIYLSENISKVSVEDVASFILAAYSKIREKRGKLRDEMLNKREPQLMIWEILRC